MKNTPNATDPSSTDSPDRICASICSEAGPNNCRFPKSSLWSGFLVSAFSVFDTHSECRHFQKNNEETSTRGHGWTAAVKRVINSGSMRRIQERVLGHKTISNSASDIWLLGVCYKIVLEDPSQEPVNTSGYAAFSEDFSSRILMTYRKGFAPIGDSKYTSDVNWGCMLRSSQMLVAQALLMNRLGRSWRKPLHQGYALAPGSWVGPYAMCRTWETLARRKLEGNEADKSIPMAIYVVSGDEDGERGGAPVLCIEDALGNCSEFSRGQAEWSPILLLVPLVLGLDKVNPRYLPLLAATFTFPQSLGILGGRPGASTYLIGVQDDKVFYLDPHEVQQAVNITKDNLEADTSSYHCSVIRQIPLESIDPSLAIGFYCQDKGDFDDFCSRATELAEKSDGAPLFTLTQTRHSPRSSSTSRAQEADSFDVPDDTEGSAQDDWQLL